MMKVLAAPFLNKVKRPLFLQRFTDRYSLILSNCGLYEKVSNDITAEA